MKKIYARTAGSPKSKDFLAAEEDKDRPNKALAIAAKRAAFVGISDNIAQSTLAHMNWFFPKSNYLFPEEPKMRFVKKYYPLAKTGPLLVDEPSNDREIEDCKRKATVLKKAGFRYVYIAPRMTFDEVLTQL